MSCCLCFSENSQVYTDTGPCSISSLKQSEKLLTIRKARNPTKSLELVKNDKFFTYLHFDPILPAQFLIIKCNNGKEIEISGEHLIFTQLDSGKVKAIHAKDVHIGTKLVQLDGNAYYEITVSEVVGINHTSSIGAYAPLTKSGTLIVNGFFVSCYAHVKSHKMAHLGLAPLRYWHDRAIKIKSGKSSISSTTMPSEASVKKTKKEESIVANQGIHEYAKFLLKIRDVVGKN